MQNIKYIIHYDINNDEGRSFTLSAVNKANYIIRALNDIGYDVDIVSASLTSSKKRIKGSKTKLSENVSLTKLPAVKVGKGIRKIPAFLWRNIAMLIFLVFNTKRNEEIIVYHSLALMHGVKWAKRLKGFKLILEVEEIYNDVIKKSEKQRKKEIDFIGIADKYIFPTEMLNECLNKGSKPYTVIHGTYQTEPDRGERFGDDKIHVLYAGTLDTRKGGAAAAAETAAFLPDNYHIHILGFGGTEDVKNIKQIIENAGKKTKALVTYDGLLSGEDYIRFLQKCQIGLSTQNPYADFNATSFPSKILSYMANGLRVVSIRIPVVESAAIGGDMYYYNEQTPNKIAEAITAVDFNDEYDSRKKIKELDLEFKKALEEFLG